MSFSSAVSRLSFCTLICVNYLHAVPRSTGFFAGVDFGGAYNRFDEHFRGKNEKKKDQRKIVKENKNSFFVGAHIGYGYEMPCGFFVGGKVYGLYNNAEIKEKSGFVGEVKLSGGDAFNCACLSLSGKPRFSLGGSLIVGGKIVPNVLVYAQCGFDSTFWKVSQTLAFYQDSYPFGYLYNDEKDATYLNFVGKEKMSVNIPSCGEIKQSVFSIVPGIGMKYFFGNGVYVGAEMNVPVGLFRKVDSEKFKFEGTIGDGHPIAFQNHGDLYLGRNISFRYGLTIGYKF